MKKILLFCLFFALFITLERFCHRQTAGFSENKITSAYSQEPITLMIPQALEAALDQPYYFLASGGQSYVFLSRDGNIVLKFFKNHHVRFWNLLHRLALPAFLEPYRKAFLEKHRHQSPLFFQSCQIAYSEFKERTGLLYLHLGQTKTFKNKLTLYDKIGVIHHIDLNETDFALQMSAEMPREKLRILIRENDLDAAKRCLDSLVALLLERCQKGIHDRDPNIRRNFGFVGDTAIELDLGSFTKDDSLKSPEEYRKEITEKTEKLKKWLERHNPSLSQYLTEKISRL